MSNHNYTQYSNNKKNDNFEFVEPVNMFESSLTASVDETNAPVATLVEETVETVTLPETVKGTVTNCAKLNVRVKPDIDADIVCVLDSKSEVEVDAARSSTDWLKICTTSGVEGFCMRKYVDAKL